MLMLGPSEYSSARYAQKPKGDPSAFADVSLPGAREPFSGKVLAKLRVKCER
jgi:hypothetical protein